MRMLRSRRAAKSRHSRAIYIAHYHLRHDKMRWALSLPYRRRTPTAASSDVVCKIMTGTPGLPTECYFAKADDWIKIIEWS